MALNESDIMRVHKDFKKQMCKIHDDTGIPITQITKKIADMNPLTVKKADRK